MFTLATSIVIVINIHIFRGLHALKESGRCITQLAKIEYAYRPTPNLSNSQLTYLPVKQIYTI